MGLFDNIQDKFENNDQIKAKIEELKAKNENGELTDKGKEMLAQLRQRLGK